MCSFNEAMITVRRAPVEHHFELVITRVFESGDQELLEDDEESQFPLAFLVKPFVLLTVHSRR